MLHTLARTAVYFDTLVFFDLLDETDVVLLWQDGVNLGIKGSKILNTIRKKNIPVFSLVPDIKARGLTNIYDGYVTPVSIEQCVELTELHKPQLAW